MIRHHVTVCLCFFPAVVRSGTTLNLLKFPIINPTPYRMFKRQERLNEASRQTESELTQDELKTLKQFSRQGYLVGKTGETGGGAGGGRRVEGELSPMKQTVDLSTCPGRVGRTFQPGVASRRDEIEFDPDSLAFGENEDRETEGEDTSDWTNGC